MRLLLQERHALHARHSPACLCCCERFQNAYAVQAVRRRRTPVRCAAWCCACCSSTPASIRGAPAWLQQCVCGTRLPMRLAGDHAQPWLEALDLLLAGCSFCARTRESYEALLCIGLSRACGHAASSQAVRCSSKRADCRRAAQGSEGADQAAHSAHTARRARLWRRHCRRKS